MKIYCIYGNGGSDYWLVTKLAEKISYTILTDALYYSVVNVCYQLQHFGVSKLWLGAIYAVIRRLSG